MARFAVTAVLFAAALGAAVAVAPCSEGVCVDVQGEDSSAVGVELLQRDSHKQIPGRVCADAQVEDLSAVGVELLQRDSHKQIPGLSGIINAATNALSNVTDAISEQVSSVVSNVTESLSNTVSSVTSSLTTSAATTVASALNKTILLLGSQADELFEVCEKVRDSVLVRMKSTKADAYERLDVLEDQVNVSIGRVLPLWDNITVAVVYTSGVATAVLKSVDQEELAVKLNKTLSRVLKQANSVTESLENVSAIMDSIRNVTEEELSQGLTQVQETLQHGLRKVDAFGTHLSSAFADLTDQAAVRIAAAIPGVNATPIDEAFDSVDATVKQVAGELIDGPRELLNGLSEAVGMVEKELPGHKSSARQSASCIGLGFLGGLLAITAA